MVAERVECFVRWPEDLDLAFRSKSTFSISIRLHFIREGTVEFTLYGFLSVYYGVPPVFSGISMAWFFNPHVGYRDMPFEINPVLRSIEWLHNGVIFLGLTGLYLAFGITLWVKRSSIASTAGAVHQNAANKLVTNSYIIDIEAKNELPIH